MPIFACGAGGALRLFRPRDGEATAEKGGVNCAFPASNVVSSRVRRGAVAVWILCKRIDKSMRFGIVTPVLNGEKFLDQTVLSVVSQAGPFTIRYHVQDGGSKDGTLQILAA